MPRRRNWDQAAGLIWPHLTAAAASGRMLTYGELAPLIATNPLSVGQALGPIQSYCLEARLMPLTAIVINKARRKPGVGFIAWDIDSFEEAAKAVFAFDWRGVENPFVGFVGGKTEVELAAELNADPSNAANVYRTVRDRGVAQRIFRVRSWPPTVGGAAFVSCLSRKFCRQPISPAGASVRPRSGWIQGTDCCCAQTIMRCSTRRFFPSFPTIGCSTTTPKRQRVDTLTPIAPSHCNSTIGPSISRETEH